MQQFDLIDSRWGYFDEYIAFEDFLAAHRDRGSGFAVLVVAVVGPQSGFSLDDHFVALHHQWFDRMGHYGHPVFGIGDLIGDAY